MHHSSSHRIGFISTRFAGTDGVSLETSKWAHVLEEMGHVCYYFAGQCDRPAERSRVVPEEAMEKMAEDPAAKIIIPAEAAALLGALAGGRELMADAARRASGGDRS